MATSTAAQKAIITPDESPAENLTLGQVLQEILDPDHKEKFRRATEL